MLILFAWLAHADVMPPRPVVPDVRCEPTATCPEGQIPASVSDREAWAYSAWTFLCRTSPATYVYCAIPGTAVRQPYRRPQPHVPEPVHPVQPEGDDRYIDLGADCTDLHRLEPAAVLGKLSPAIMTCVEQRAADPADPERAHASLVAMGNLYSAGDTARWYLLTKRHVTEIDREDPDLFYKLALWTSREGKHDEAMGYVESMLGLLDEYTDEANREKRRQSGVAVAAKSSYALWKAGGTPEAVEEAAARTRKYAAAWVAFAPDVVTAQQICLEVGCG